MRAIPDDNVTLPVFVKSGTCVGSGIFVNAPGAIYLFTARHVLFGSAGFHGPTAQLTLAPSDPRIAGTISLDLNLELLNANGCVVRHPDADLAAIKIGVVESLPSEPSRLVINHVAGITSDSPPGSSICAKGLDGLRRYADVLISNDVFVLGYPASIGLQHMPQFDYARPLLRRGIVAGKYDAKRSIVIDCVLHHGNSGGPVLQLEQIGGFVRYELIGLVSELIPSAATDGLRTTNSGYAVVSALDPLLELLEL